ncbi:MAG: DUF3567 family protein [Burkholderiales bacterium]
MNVLYDNGDYYVTEFPGGGIELVDTRAGRGAYLEGALERQFRAGMAHLISDGTDEESVEAFLGGYRALLTNPMVFH